MITKLEQCIARLGSEEEKEAAIKWVCERSGNHYIPHDPEEGQLTLGVVYHMLRKRDIEQMFRKRGEEPPRVIGWVVAGDEDEEED